VNKDVIILNYQIFFNKNSTLKLCNSTKYSYFKDIFKILTIPHHFFKCSFVIYSLCAFINLELIN